MKLTNKTKFDIATSPNRNSRSWDQGTITWGEVVGWLDNPSDEKEAGNYVFGMLRGKRRLKNTILHRGVIALDADSPSEDFLESLHSVMGDCAYIVHTTFSSTEDNPRYRVLIPLPRNIVPQEYKMAVDVLMERIGEMSFDPGSAQAERYMFKPSVQKGEEFRAWVYDESGNMIDVDDLIDSWGGDLEELPQPSVSKNKRDPTSLKGTPGVFNKVYDNLEELIDIFELPYDMVSENRYRFQGASGAPGMGPIEGSDNLFYSHHSHDPAYGVTCSAFDLVRLHKFSHLDEDCSDKTPINRLPSNSEMLKFAVSDPRVRAEASKAATPFDAVIGDDFREEMEGIADSVDPKAWLDRLDIDEKTMEFTDSINNIELIAKNDPVLQKVYYNSVFNRMEVLNGNLPWREVTPKENVFTEHDSTEARMHIEKHYHNLRLSVERFDFVMAKVIEYRRWNPVEEYLLSLEWDGVCRLEESLPGVIPTTYTRMVARKIFTAAVARILDPGVKWDHMLMIYGKGGLGKSHWIEKMSRGWSDSLGKIGDKDTVQKMFGTWITVADEGHALRRAGFDQLKEFITQTKDSIRLPYAKNMTSTPRHNVFWGTTNDHSFLLREEGNRRFLVVEAVNRCDFSEMTDEYIDQVWAEAVHLYRSGESLVLDDTELKMAEGVRELYTQEDSLTGMIEEYVDTEVPDNWDQMNPLDRMDFLNGGGVMADFGDSPDLVQHICAIQVWCEVLERRRGDSKPADISRISETLRNMSGWRQAATRLPIRGYGRQVVFERVSVDEEINDLI